MLVFATQQLKCLDNVTEMIPTKIDLFLNNKILFVMKSVIQVRVALLNLAREP